VRARPAGGQAWLARGDRLTFKITLSYDGADYVGWQRQASGVSIQGLIEDVLAILDGGRAVAVAGAGRTDAGVHALGQVASFTLTREIAADTLVRALNAHLPPAVRVLDAAEAPPDFHARFTPSRKTYRYQIWNHDVMNPLERAHAWHVPGRLDVEAMRAAARRLEGRHDFAAFQGTGGEAATTEREIFSSTLQSAICNMQFAMICYEVTGNGFLRHMVRTIVGTLVEIGRGRQPVAWVNEVVASRDRTQAGRTAPAHGLFLVRVEYSGALAAGS
jgi:tRNA pseudouridine38-40 synthase